ncbi:hypothetical protein CIB48_g9873 [Xylaria polymorpha]|nr:hypothetical protein CIB48_g9873 [Xylaria polymorpha]
MLSRIPGKLTGIATVPPAGLISGVGIMGIWKASGAEAGKCSPEIMKFPASPRGSSRQTPSNKRRVTPSAEQSSPRGALIVTTANRGPLPSQGEILLKPFSVPRQLFSHAHPSSKEQEDTKATWHQQHILLPFNLRDLSNDIYGNEVSNLLYNIFPETTNVTEARWRSHLIFQVKKLPKSPWPLTVGGVPFTICSDDDKGRALIFPRQMLGNFEISICQDGYKVNEFSDQELRELGADVHSCKILKEHGHPAVFSTTSGILVQNNSGTRLMTAASHGIADDRNVWQGEGDYSSRSIGEAVLEISCTDICLVKLKNDIMFVNETFENTSGDSPNFTRLATSEDRFISNQWFLNSPYTGNMEATIVAKSVRMPSTHPTEDNLRYFIYNWSYMGQMEGNEDRVRPPDGTCGSVIWDDNGVITGFYHYYIETGRWEGFSVSVSASELVKAGYTLVVN